MSDLSQPSHNHIPNLTVDPVTGFIQSTAYAHAFDGEKKKIFLRRWKENGLALYRTCRELGMSCSTIHHHRRIDPEFSHALDEVEKEYIDELEATSRINALVPKMVIERIFQLKALRPEKYGDAKCFAGPQIIINIDGNTIVQEKSRVEVLDAEVLKSVENQVDNSTSSHNVNYAKSAMEGEIIDGKGNSPLEAREKSMLTIEQIKNPKG